MKKAIVLLLALAVLGGAVFAQDEAPKAGLTGYVYAGAVVDQDLNVSAGPDWVSEGNYATLGMAYNAKSAGFSATIEFENDAVNSAFRDYTAWAKFANDMVKVSAGKLRNGDYRLTSYIDGSGYSTRTANAELGLALQVYPIEGLNIGAFVPVADGAIAEAKYAFGAAYTLPELAKIVAAYKMGKDEFSIGVDVKAVPGLTAKLAYKNVSTAGAASNTIYATAGYGLLEGALDLGLDSYFAIAATNTIYAKVKAGYTVTEVIIPAVYFALKNTTAGNAIDAGLEVKLDAAGKGAVYTGFDFSRSATAVNTWGIPLYVEVSF